MPSETPRTLTQNIDDRRGCTRPIGGSVRVLPTSLVAQRDAVLEVDAPIAVFSRGLAVRTAAAGSAAAFPGMVACRVPERWITQGWCHLRPGIQIADIGGIRIVLAGSRRSSSAPLLAIGFAARITGPVRHAAADEGASAWRSRMTLSAADEDVLRTCAKALSQTEPKPEMWLLGVSRTLLKPDWNWPVHGLRYLPADGTSGWYIWVGELTADADFFVSCTLGT